MCGIAGLIGKKSKIEKGYELNKMLDAINHRGPDGRGVSCFNFKGIHGGVFLETMKKSQPSRETWQGYDGIIGHNRLSILDLSERGHQPMVSHDGRAAIVYNGEVYNAFDYRNLLRKCGYEFRSETDTEVVLYMYLHFGLEKMLHLLNGMFAFCIVDLEEGKAYLARDRFGIKPLYYVESNKELMFASEVKCFLQRSSFSRGIDYGAVTEYFAFRSCNSSSLIKNVKQVGAGEIVCIGKDGLVSKTRWFDVNNYCRGFKDLNLRELSNVIDEAVNGQMVSDVKVGCQLSGGIDSSLVSFYAKKTNYDDAISIVFSDKEFSEEDHMEHVARKINIKLHKACLDTDYFLKNWEKMTWHMDVMVNHPNTLGIKKLAEESKKYVTVLLSGEGADEVCAGYDNFLMAFFMEHLGGPPLSWMIRARYPKWVALADDDINKFILQSHGYSGVTMVHNILSESPDFGMVASRYNRIIQYSGSIIDKMVKYDIEYHLPELLMRQDKMTMAHSVENRVPYLDNHFVDYIFSNSTRNLLSWKLPHSISLKSNNFVTGKYLLKQLCVKVYGKSFTYRKKSGFALPVKHFLCNKKFVSYFKEDIIPSMKTRGIINAEYIDSMFNYMENLSQAQQEIVWRAASFETWCQLFIDGRRPKALA